jgi:GT2 family glycosyltransferase
MTLNAADFAPGTIVIPTNVTSRYTDFHVSLLNTRIPSGTSIQYAMGTSIDKNRNSAITQAKGDWIWFLDDDHVWEPDLLLHLLSHNVDIVAPLTCKRNAPWEPLVYGRTDENGNYVPLHLPDEQPRLRQVIATSTAGMLVRKQVLQEMAHPWFEMGKLSSETTGEDIYFCHKARKLGFKVYADLTRSMPHIHLHTVNLVGNENKEWYVNIQIEDKNIGIPLSK